MGGRGGSSGLGGGGSGFSKMSMSGKTGTEKQKQYAESLADSAYRTAKANGVAGYSKPDSRGMRSYTSQKDADAVKAAYKFLKYSVDNRRTYGEVISLLKNTSVLDLKKQLEPAAKKAGKSVSAYVDELLKKAKKAR